MPVKMDLAEYNKGVADGTIIPPGIDSDITAELDGGNVIFNEPANGGSESDKAFMAAVSKRAPQSL